MLEIAAHDYLLRLAPDRGGSVLELAWRGQNVLRPACGSDITEAASFPLVPFSNRIAKGRFVFDGRETIVPPNAPSADADNPLHGYGWLSAWNVDERGEDWVRMSHDYPGGPWPWRYRAVQTFRISRSGLHIGLGLKNLSSSRMPAGLGFHPYFPCNAATRYLALHRGEWSNDPAHIPTTLDLREAAIDWWGGRPACSRVVNTVYTDRVGDILLEWPDRAMRAVVSTSENLAHTVVYRPDGADFICVEPVSHFTNALNRSSEHGRMASLAPGEEMTATMSIAVT